jgi:nucleoside-diphosphate-sugar epimerase
MAILMTGASGFVGRALTEKLVEEGHKIYALSRHPPKESPLVIPLEGDITRDSLGLAGVPGNIAAVYHVAGSHMLGPDPNGDIWRTNVLGTENVLKFCEENEIHRLVFISTAYTWHVNPYGQSKAVNEEAIWDFAQRYQLRVTIHKPSVIMGTAAHPYPGHFSQFVRLLLKIHRGAETARRTLQEKLSLPQLEPVFRIKGRAEGTLNLVSIDDVVRGICSRTGIGTYYLTNPNPPTLGELVQWVGEYLKVDIRILPYFRPNALEKQFEKMAGAFVPYLQGDDFPSDIMPWTKIDRAFIHRTVKGTID